MKQLKKCYYLILLVTVGIVYLSKVDRWKVYAQVVEKVKEFCVGAGDQEDSDKSAGDGGQGFGEDFQSPERSEPGAGNPAEDGGDQAFGTSDIFGDGQGQDGNGTGEETAEGVGQGPDGMAEGVGSDGQPSVQLPSEDMPAEPVFVAVEDDYFSDAVFIGDSRTVGMYEYSGLEEISTFYASTGLTIYKIFDSEIVTVPGQKKKITIEEALQENSFAKIYLMIGINEMGVGTVETFISKYSEVVEHLQELQPDAIIYIQGIIRVTTARSNQGDYISNEGIEARNRELEKLANNRNIFYLDVNPLICDETGGLIDSYTFDGVHLKAKYIQIWKDYLKENAIESYSSALQQGTPPGTMVEL